MCVQTYTDGQLTLERRVEDGRGKCPFDPSQRHTSLMLGKYQESSRGAVEQD